jgi:predicted GNAT superfamily acetyltransferase
MAKVMTMAATPFSIEQLTPGSVDPIFAELAALQAELAIAFKLLEAGVRESDTGFLISAYKPEHFRDFVQRGGLILTARATEDRRLLGYLLGNSGHTFLANHPTTQLLWDSEQREREYGPIYASGRFTYLDQIGVALASHGTGVARSLHEHFIGLVAKPVLAAIVQEPLRNKRSTDFFLRLGYQQIGMFHTAELKGLRDVRSAVLVLPDSSANP